MQIVETWGGYAASKVANLGLKSLTCRQASVSVSLSSFRGRAETSWFPNTRVRSWDEWRHGCSEDFLALVSTINPSVCPERSDIILGFHQLLEPLPPWARSRVWMTAVHFLSCLIMQGNAQDCRNIQIAFSYGCAKLSCSTEFCSRSSLHSKDLLVFVLIQQRFHSVLSPWK